MPPISNQYGRVDDENNVFVHDNGTERKVGQYPGVSLAEAMAYFERKFQELDGNVRILEQRVKINADPQSIASAAEKLTKELAEPTAVGNIQELRNRVAKVTPNIEQLKKEKTESIQKAIEITLALRTEIAAKAKTLAEKDPAKTQWKSASKDMTELFDKWQASQKSGPKVPKKQADEIWKIFSHARTKFESNKRAFFAELTTQTKNARAMKAELATKAEALISKGSDAASDYRKLLDQWKTSGRSQGKQDDGLWERFKAAGDAIYALRKESIAKEQIEYQANYEAKLAILVEVEKIDPAKDLGAAKKNLLALSTRYEKIGKVAKDKIRETDDRIRTVEKKIKDLEQEHWRKSDPAAIERTNDVLTQLEDSIMKLEDELASAKVSKDPKKAQEAEAALVARKSWLEVVKANAN